MKRKGYKKEGDEGLSSSKMEPTNIMIITVLVTVWE